MLTYAIGDVHGHLDKLQNLHKRIEDDAGDRAFEIIHVGDLCDRGPQSREVYEYLIAGQEADKPWLVIKGNHDRMLQNFVRLKTLIDVDTSTKLEWLNPRMGGVATLESLGVDTVKNVFTQIDKIPEKIVSWIENLPLMIDRGRALFVHAGISHKKPFDAQREVHCLWIRDGFLDYEKPFGKLIIHGHTMVDKVTHFGNRIDIDTGAGRGDALSAIVIDGDEIFDLQPEGRIALAPPPSWTLWGKKIS